MNDAHVYEMQVQMWKPNTWGVIELLVSHYLVATYTPSHPLLGHTLAYFLTIAYTTHYICDVMLGGGLYVSG